MAQIVLLFLVFMALIGLFGGFRTRGGKRKLGRSKFCPDCGRPRIGKGPCPCGAES